MKMRNLLSSSLAQFFGFALVILCATLWLQSEHLRNAAVGDEILYLESLKCGTKCNYFKSFFELHIPAIKMINSVLYYNFNHLMPLRLLGVVWFSLFGSSFFFLCRKYFSGLNSAIITVATLMLPIPWSYATAYENLLPLLFFITMLIKSTHENDESKISLWFIMAGLVHISGLLFAPPIILCYLKKTNFKNPFTRFRSAFIFIALYALYIALLLVGREVFGWEYHSHRVDRHFDIPRTWDQLYSNFSSCLFIIERYIPVIFAVLIPAFAFNSQKKDQLLIGQTTGLLLCYLALQSSYNSFAIKNAAVATLFCLPAFLVILKDIGQVRLTIVVLITAFFYQWHLPESYLTGRYRLPTLKVQLGYNYRVMALIKHYEETCSISLGSNMGLFSSPLFGYTNTPYTANDSESNSEILVRYHEFVNVKDIMEIAPELNIHGRRYPHRLVFHNLSAFATRPLEKLEAFKPTLPDHEANDRSGFALVLYSRTESCLSKPSLSSAQ